MFKLLQLLIFGHVHEWETMETMPLEFDNGLSYGTCTAVLMRCKKCGNWKRQILR
jgi:hypothetical protein